MTRRIYDVANIQAGAFDILWAPRTIRGADKFGVVLLHGATLAGVTTAAEFDVYTWPELSKLAFALANEGIPCVAGYMRGNGYANDGVMTDVTAAINYMAAATGCSAAKAHMIGVSMGGGTGVRYASLNPGKVATAQGLIPMASIESIHTDNPGLGISGNASFTQSIAAAWGLAWRSVTDAVISTGGTGKTLTSATAAFTAADVGRQVVRGSTQLGIPADTKIASVTNGTTVELDKAVSLSAGGQIIGIADPLPMAGDAGADLLGHHAARLDLNGIPNRWFYASNDPFVYTADVVQLANAAAGEAVNLGAVGHARTAAAAWAAYDGGSDYSELIAFLKDNGS